MNRPRTSAKNVILLWVRGVAIGSADLVPGVSGGTVALVTRIYPRLLMLINLATEMLVALLRGDWRKAGQAFRRVDWWFAGALIVGAGMAIATFAPLIDFLLEEQPVRTAATFAGLMAGAVVLAGRMLYQWSAFHLILTALVGGTAFAVFGLRAETVSQPAWWAFFLAGVVGVCAFILPGVSGSFVLLAIGMYQPVIGALTDRDIGVLAVFAVGLAIGLGSFARVLEKLLARFHDPLLAVMIGLMIGSFRILWPWPNGLGDENGVGATVVGAPSSDVVVPIVLAAVSCGAVIAFALWAGRMAGDPTHAAVGSQEASSDPSG